MPRAPQAQKGAAGDGVFMRLMALPKGRGMLTRALRVLYAPPLPLRDSPRCLPAMPTNLWLPPL